MKVSSVLLIAALVAAVSANDCSCVDGACNDGKCIGCNMQSSEGSYCFNDVDKDSCIAWGKPYVACYLDSPTAAPTKTPSDEPTTMPSDMPTVEPTEEPAAPTRAPTPAPESKCACVDGACNGNKCTGCNMLSSDGGYCFNDVDKDSCLAWGEPYVACYLDSPTVAPTSVPSNAPTTKPSVMPTKAPTAAPTEEPSEDPTEEPSDDPTEEPSEDPTEEPSDDPTEEPSEDKTDAPSDAPTHTPSAEPTNAPTAAPTGDCACNDGACNNGKCIGCNMLGSDGGYCFNDVDKDSCLAWGKPYAACYLDLPTPAPTPVPSDAPSDDPTEEPATEEPTVAPSEGDCVCLDGEGCQDSVCVGCNMGHPNNEGSYCFNDVTEENCVGWGKPFSWCPAARR
ncbi:hypothetical protein ACHHYP_10078 [Achlya hypogyna]|uniref:Secreted protein n=1 Tax=Achlya hypogyna TaxID=1202772 RepID=A0A1V9ZIV8_ACHHY|nr:hypothetical protein ACHHYP_10078 [Achlya hypogyna]